MRYFFEGIGFSSLVLSSGYLLGWFGFHLFFVFIAGIGFIAWKYLLSVETLKRDKKLFQSVSQRKLQWESAGWLNSSIGLMWKCYVDSWNSSWKESLNRYFHQKRPSILSAFKIDRFNLGAQPPTVEHLESVVELREGTLRLIFTLSWLSSIKASVKGQIKNGPLFSANISKIVFRSKLVVVGKLHPASPFYFGNVTVTTEERPTFDVKVALAQGQESVMAIPAFGNWFRQFISGEIFDSILVAPNSFTFSLCPEASRDLIPTTSQKEIDWEPIEEEVLKSQQYGGNYLKSFAWKSILEEVVLQTQVFGPKSVVAMDGPDIVCEPVLCRILQGSITMYVVWHDEDRPYVGFLNPGGNFSESSQIHQVNESEAVRVCTMTKGEYFAETTFVNPYRKDPPTWSVLFVADTENTEVGALNGGHLKQFLEGHPSIHAQFYVSAAHCLRTLVSEVNKVKNVKLAPPGYDPETRLLKKIEMKVEEERGDLVERKKSEKDGKKKKKGFLGSKKDKKEKEKEKDKDKEKEKEMKKKRAYSRKHHSKHSSEKTEKTEKTEETSILDSLRKGNLHKKKVMGLVGGKNWQKVFHLAPTQEVQMVFNAQMRQKEDDGMWVSGSLVLFEDFLGFHGTFFGSKFNFLSRYYRMESKPHPKHPTNGIHIQSASEETFFKFSKSEIRDQCLGMITAQIEIAKEDVSDPQMAGLEENVESAGLTDADWRLLVRGSQGFRYQKDQIVLMEGEVTFGLFQIASGSVRIEKNTPGGKIVVAHLATGEIFGEMSLLQATTEVEDLRANLDETSSSGGGAAGASVIADSDELDVYFVSGDYLFKQVEKDPSLNGRFYNYLCDCLAQRFYKTLDKILT